MICKVISGGQTGADLAGLQAAREFDIPTGGWAPKGWGTEEGPNLELRDLYGLTEAPTDDYAARRRLNVRDADMTVIVVYDPDSRGTKGAIKDCQQLDKKFWVFDPRSDSPLAGAGLVAMHADFVERPVVVNVAGNRASTAPPWFVPAARLWFGNVFSLLRVASAQRGRLNEVIAFHAAAPRPGGQP